MYGLSHWLFKLLALSYPSTLASSHAQSPQTQAAQDASKIEQQQDVVKWDEHSILIHGRRVMLFSGEFHPFRLPSPELWLDVFQKISSMGYTAVSFYLDWALLEGERGHIRAEGIFALEPFFEAAQRAGLYLIARPGPYINSETSGGGLPGWLQRNKGLLRSTADDYIASTQLYLSDVLSTVERFQITHGGPVIMVQYENEYSISDTPESRAILPKLFVTGQALDSNDIDALSTDLFPNYMEQVKHQFEDAGIVVPLMINDAVPAGNWAPGTGKGAADMYTIDNYPFPYGFTCELHIPNFLHDSCKAADTTIQGSDPTFWPLQFWPASIINHTALHDFSPKTPLGIAEFQGGQPEAWYVRPTRPVGI
jgi:hypothetical protein